MDKIKRAALYIRVSTEEQARHGYSLAAQLEDLKAYATKKKYKIVDAYIDEGVSARKKPFNRKEFKRLLEDVKGLLHTFYTVLLWQFIVLRYLPEKSPQSGGGSRSAVWR